MTIINSEMTQSTLNHKTDCWTDWLHDIEHFCIYIINRETTIGKTNIWTFSLQTFIMSQVETRQQQQQQQYITRSTRKAKLNYSSSFKGCCFLLFCLFFCIISTFTLIVTHFIKKILLTTTILSLSTIL